MALTGYKLVKGDEQDELERRVLDLAADGYIPYGGAHYEEGARVWIQTMVIGDVAGGGGGGGGATSLAELTDVSLGLLSPLAPSDMLIVGDTGEEGTTWTNYPSQPLIVGLIEAFGPGVVTTYLTGLPGYNAANTQTLTNATGTISWVDVV